MKYPNDGVVRIPNPEDIVPGVVIRMVDGSEAQYVPAFSDAVVLQVKDDQVTLGRPYAYASLTETSCPTVLTGVERYETTIQRCCKYYRIVLLSTGEPNKRLT